MDAAALEKLLLRMEADTHRCGWDCPPGLFVVYEHANRATEQAYAVLGPPLRVGPVTAREAVHPSALLPAPSHALFRMAANMAYAAEHPSVTMFVDTMRQPGFIGIAVLFEGWRWDGTPEERAAFGGRSLADVPGAAENRMVTLATGDGVLHIVQRIRGQKPRIIEGWDHHGGAMIESLLAITATIAGTRVPQLTCTPFGWEED